MKSKVPQFFKVTASTNIARRSMSQLLAYSRKKQCIAELLLISLTKYLASRGLQYVVAGNHKTFRSTNAECENNHEEADTLLIHCLTFCVNTRSVLIFDTDIAVLLIAHLHRLPFQNIYFGVTANAVEINVLHTFLVRFAGCLFTTLLGVTL